jgi:hypothetical protein
LMFEEILSYSRSRLVAKFLFAKNKQRPTDCFSERKNKTMMVFGIVLLGLSVL